MSVRPFCFAFLAALALAAFTGGALALGYVPSDGQAWLSVLAIERTWGGSFVRGVHRAAAEAAMVSGALAIAVALGSASRSRRDSARIGAWLFALLLVFVLVVTGNPLRDDNAGRFALSIEVNVVGTLPLLGGAARKLLLGAGSDQTLTARLFARHALLLPTLLAFVLGVSFFVARPRSGALAESTDTRRAWAPGVADWAAALACVLAIAISALARGAPLGAPADLDSAFPARPAWYFQPLYLARQLLPAERAPALVLLAIALFTALVALLLRPLRAEVSAAARRARKLGVSLALGAYGALAVFGAARDARDPEQRFSAREEQWALERVEVLGRAGAPLQKGARQALNADPVHRARALFNEHCANCHALGDLGLRDGTARAPDLGGFGSREWVLSMLDDPDAAHRFGNTPFAGEMPSVTRPPADPALRASFRPMPADEQRAVADFLSAQAFPPELTRAASSQHEMGERLVRERCTSCHLFAGKTDDDESRAPELFGWGSAAWITAQVLNPGSGRTYRIGPRRRGEMPAFGGVLSRDEVSLLVGLIRGTLPKEAPSTGYQARVEPERAGSEE